MATLYLFNFNNYYNRVNKRYNTLQEYIENGTLLYTYQDRNFVPNDGVTTQATLNYNANEQPDYIVVTDQYNEIESRWFVIEAVRTRGGQYQVTLLRDVVTDYYDIAISNPCFIEKATLKLNDLAIFNKENMTYNQIRQSPRFLFDKSETPWVVGYIPRDSFETTQTVETTTYNLQLPDDTVTVNTIEDWEWYKYTTDGASGKQYTVLDWFDITIDGYYVNQNIRGVETTFRPIRYARKDDGTYELTGPGSDKKGYFGAKGLQGWSRIINWNASADNAKKYYGVSLYTGRSASVLTAQAVNQLMGQFYLDVPSINNLMTTAKNDLLSSIGYSENIAELKVLTGLTIKESNTGRIFRVKATLNSQSAEYLTAPATDSMKTITRSALSDWTTKVNNYAEASNVNNIATVAGAVPGNSTIKCGYKYTTYKLELEQLSAPCSVDILAEDERAHTIDAPYDIFCMPLYSMKMVYADMPPFGEEGDYFFSSKTGYSIPLATAISTTFGSGTVYDLQLLPFCPIPEAITNFGEVDLRLVSHSIIYDRSEGTPQKVGAMFWCLKESFSFTNDWDIIIEPGKTALEKKMNNETQFCRLCSPNGSGTFEFSPEMNGGVSGWKIACTYKPFQPFIQIRPIFGELYGPSTSIDYRGLICGGDFSMAQLSNQWANYQQNNSNFQAIFDREIQNLQVTQKAQRIGEIVGIGSSIINSAVGLAAGKAGAGAISGAFTGAVSMGANLAIHDRLREETLDYKQDMFGYQLGNIKAIPTSISKTAANVITNPLVPYVEFYDCTSEEKQALYNKLYYNGMTVGRIGYIQDYIQTEPSYIKGKLIRVEGLEDDTHVANALAAELDKGVFL